MKRQAEADLIKEISDLEDKLNENPTDDHVLHMNTAKKDLEMLQNETLRGVQLRAQCQHLEFNEHNSSYFFSKEKSQSKIKAIAKLILDDGQTITDTKDILNEQKRFYQKLYKEPTDYPETEVKIAEDYFLKLNPVVNKLQDNDKEALDRPLTRNEIASAVKELANNKSPGSDGLPIDWYKAFWSKISELFCESLNIVLNRKKCL
jgi:small-conductance mechanosensitive channel